MFLKILNWLAQALNVAEVKIGKLRHLATQQPSGWRDHQDRATIKMECQIFCNINPGSEQDKGWGFHWPCMHQSGNQVMQAHGFGQSTVVFAHCLRVFLKAQFDKKKGGTSLRKLVILVILKIWVGGILSSSGHPVWCVLGERGIVCQLGGLFVVCSAALQGDLMFPSSGWPI